MYARHITLVANTVSTVTFDEGDYRHIEVVNKNGAAEIHYTTDGSAPTVDGDDQHYLPAAVGANSTEEGRGRAEDTVVKLISSGTPKVYIRGW